MRAVPVWPCPAKKGAPAGTAIAFSLFSTEALTRFWIQPRPCGEGRKAGSASADHTRRPKASPKPPPTGFHALEGGAGAAPLSQPLHRKAPRVTARGKKAHAKPPRAPYPPISTPLEKVAP